MLTPVKYQFPYQVANLKPKTGVRLQYYQFPEIAIK